MQVDRGRLSSQSRPRSYFVITDIQQEQFTLTKLTYRYMTDNNVSYWKEIHHTFWYLHTRFWSWSTLSKKKMKIYILVSVDRMSRRSKSTSSAASIGNLEDTVYKNTLVVWGYDNRQQKDLCHLQEIWTSASKLSTRPSSSTQQFLMM